MKSLTSLPRHSILHELHFFSNRSQSNVHGTTLMPQFLFNNKNVDKNSVLTLHCKPNSESTSKTGLVVHYFNEDSSELIPSGAELDITGTSGAAEPIVLNSFIGADGFTFYLAVAFVMKSDSNPKFFLNIYRSSLHLPEKDALTKLIDCYVKFDLNYAPLQISHTIISHQEDLCTVFVVSAGDAVGSSSASAASASRTSARDPFSVFLPSDKPKAIVDITAFQSESNKPVQEAKVSVDSSAVFRWFPPSRKSSLVAKYSSSIVCLSNVREVLCECNHFCLSEEERVLHMNFHTVKRSSDGVTHRLSCFGMEDGHFHVFAVDLSNNSILKYLNGRHHSPITQVQFIPCPRQDQEWVLQSCLDPQCPLAYNILVCSAFEASVVYENIFRNRPSAASPKEAASYLMGSTDFSLLFQCILTHSEEHDMVLCACMADVDMDGELEIILGTFGHFLLVYKAQSSQQLLQSREKEEESSESVACVDLPWQYELLWKRQLSGAIHSIQVADVTGDGVKEILVTSSRGLHVLQYNLHDVLELLMSRLMTSS